MRTSYNRDMLAFEWLTLAYAVSYTLVAALSPRARGPVALSVPSLTVLLVMAVAWMAPPALRFAAPNLYLMLGYWIPALFVTAGRTDGSSSFERWLARSDGRFRQRLPSVPVRLLPLVEAAYLACYPLVPLAFALVWMRAGTDALPRFWLTVLLSGFACYASLPWLVSRPPQSSAPHRRHVIGRLNTLVLARVSHGWTTFPSGHVAVAWAAAFAVARVWPSAGLALAVIATGVTVGAAAGRYHFVIDVLLGLLVAAVAAVIT